MARGFGNYRIYPDDNLAKIVGSKPIKPSEMTRKIWEYIKAKRLGGYYRKTLPPRGTGLKVGTAGGRRAGKPRTRIERLRRHRRFYSKRR